MKVVLYNLNKYIRSTKWQKLTVSTKLEILEKIGSGIKINDIARQYKISIRTVYRIRNTEEKLEALKEKGRTRKHLQRDRKF